MKQVQKAVFRGFAGSSLTGHVEHCGQHGFRTHSPDTAQHQDRHHADTVQGSSKGLEAGSPCANRFCRESWKSCAAGGSMAMVTGSRRRSSTRPTVPSISLLKLSRRLLMHWNMLRCLSLVAASTSCQKSLTCIGADSLHRKAADTELPSVKTDLSMSMLWQSQNEQ